MSRNRDRNSRKIANIPSSDFSTKQHILNFTFFVDKNNASTLIRVCWFRFLYQFRHNNAHNASKLALKLWKSKNLTYSILDEQSKWVKVKIAKCALNKHLPIYWSCFITFFMHQNNSIHLKKKKNGRSNFCHFFGILNAILPIIKIQGSLYYY